ncbi:MAG: superoxide dismutase [Lysinibacillus sp.]
MNSFEKSYRESIMNWCEEMEGTWKTVRKQLSNNIDEPTLQQWENAFYALKKDNDTLSDIELYNRANILHGELKNFYEKATITNEVQNTQPVPIGGHQLPPLPYSYNALEPVISEEIMRLHHTKHHQSYVDGLNKAESELKKARETGNFNLIKHWERELAFNGAGHYLHTIFWGIMSPNGGGQPTDGLMTAIESAFGSFDNLKKQFSEAAKNVEGGGWAILVWAPRSHRLEILTAEKHQNLSQWDVIPLLVLDVWEHAYYLQYKNERAKYVDNWWKIVNWTEVEHRFNKARTIQWKPF